MLPLGFFYSYGQPDREQTIRLIKIWNHEHPDKEPGDFTEDNIKAAQIAYQYRNWPEKLEKYEGIDL